MDQQQTVPSARLEILTAGSTSLDTLDPESMKLLQVYQKGIASWLDLFDDSLSYQREVPQRALVSPLIRESICALSAKQLELINECHAWTAIAAQRYGESLRLLIKACREPDADEQDILTATILLSSVELLASPGSDHKRHLSGASAIIRCRKINATCTGLDRAAFWIYARQDLAVALMNECSTSLSPTDWAVSWSESKAIEHGMGNHILWLCSCVVNFIFGSQSDSREQDNLQQELSTAVDEWFERVPWTLQGVACGKTDQFGFMELWFPLPVAAAAMATYHQIRILLLTKSEESDKLSFPNEIQYHAMQIGSIGTSNIADGSLVQIVHPLFYGKWW